MREADSFESMSTALTCTYTDKAGEVVRLSMAKISSAIPDKDFRMATCPKCCGKMNKRTDGYFHCRRHGRGRKIMTPQLTIVEHRKLTRWEKVFIFMRSLFSPKPKARTRKKLKAVMK